MTTAIHLCGGRDQHALVALAQRRWQEAGAECDGLEEAIAPLLDGGPLGAAYLFGPPRAPVGYLLLGFFWSIKSAAIEAQVLDFYIRPSIRRRGIGTEVLHDIVNRLSSTGISGIELRPSPQDSSISSIAARLGFASDDQAPSLRRALT